MRVHPAANLFPQLNEEELENLAADIAANGQLEKIVLVKDKNGESVILDGRNRFMACELVGVKPKFTTITCDDPYTYVVSANIKRRNLSVGQLSLVAALILAARGRKTKGGPKTVEDSTVSTREAADMVGLGEGAVKTVIKAVKLAETAGLLPKEKGGYEPTPAAKKLAKEQINAVQNREVTLEKAFGTVYPTEPVTPVKEEVFQRLINKLRDFRDEYGDSDKEIVDAVAAGLAEAVDG